MDEKLSKLYLQLGKPIIGRIIRQFGDFTVDREINGEMTDQQLFNTLVEGRGKGKSRNSKYYPRHEGEVRGS